MEQANQSADSYGANQSERWQLWSKPNRALAVMGQANQSAPYLRHI